MRPKSSTEGSTFRRIRSTTGTSKRRIPNVDPDRGVANYYTIDVDGQRLPDAAWFYPAPLDVDEITGYITFAGDVLIR